MQLQNGFSLHCGYRPGLVGTVAALFGQAFIKDYGFGSYFECKVATEIAAFIETYDPAHSRIWSVEKEGRIYGSLTLYGKHAEQDGAHVRWFILHPDTRGRGFGQVLMDEMMSFAHDQKFSSLYLYTLGGLEPAGQLYRRRGFVLEERFEGDQWGNKVIEEKLRLILP